MANAFAALGIGFFIALGLGISGMTNPARIISFLDVSSGSWDPTLAVVMFAALAVSIPAYRLIRLRKQPVLGGKFQIPTRSEIDLNLIMGALIFGLGWGLSGFCPGPVIVALVHFKTPIFVFVVSMLMGALAHQIFSKTTR